MNMDKIWQFFIMTIIVIAIASLVTIISRPKHTVRYELFSYNNLPAINVDVENAADHTICLSKEISWSKAVQLVDSLNNTLKPIK